MIPQTLNKSFTQPAKVHADLDFPIYLNKKAHQHPPPSIFSISVWRRRTPLIPAQPCFWKVRHYSRARCKNR